MRINIAGGTGRMGTEHAPLLRKRGHEVIISGRNTSPNLEEAARIADLTIVSVLLNATKETIKRLGPLCAAMMDFSSAKYLPVKWMLEHTKEECEVTGMHPLYGRLGDPKTKTIVCCLTNKTGERCLEVIDALAQSGITMMEMSPEEHDRYVLTKQNDRALKLLQHGMTYLGGKRDILEAYRLAPTSEKVILDLIARQIAPENDEMFFSMRALNPFQSKMTKKEEKLLRHAPKRLRDFYGDHLSIAQERAKKVFNDYSI